MAIDTIDGKGRPAEILLVEDNPGDVLLTKKAFSGAKIANNITVAGDGDEALSILRRDGAHAGNARPDIILLDLNLPKKSGKDVLSEIKADPRLKNIPVIILTSSIAETDVVKSYNLHANGYVVKPVSFEKFVDVVKSIEHFWLSVVALPDDEVSNG